jgi:hypothetical protein
MVARALKREGKHVLLIVDDLDELYRVAPTDPSRFAIANETLYDLAWLGTQVTGRFGTLLCGSSAVTPLLIVGDSAELASEFPRVVGAPDLNGTKFREWRVPSPHCTDLAAVESMLEQRTGGRPSRQLTRLVAFIGGATARGVLATTDTISFATATSVVDLRVPSSSGMSNRTLDSDTGKLYNALLARMVVENRGLCEQLLTRSGHIDAAKVASVPWEEEFKPLTWRQVEDEFRRLVASGAVSAGTGRSPHIAMLLYRACDRGYLAYHGIQQGLPRHIYPFALSDVVVASTQAAGLAPAAFATTFDVVVKKGWDDHNRRVPVGAAAAISIDAVLRGAGRMEGCT